MGKKTKHPTRGSKREEKSPEPTAAKASKLDLDDHLKDTIIDLLMQMEQLHVDESTPPPNPPMTPGGHQNREGPPLPPSKEQEFTCATPSLSSSETTNGEGSKGKKQIKDARRHFLKELVKSDQAASKEKAKERSSRSRTAAAAAPSAFAAAGEELGQRVRLTLRAETVKPAKKAGGPPKTILGEARAVVLARAGGHEAVLREAKNKLKAKGKALWAYVPETGEAVPAGPLTLLDDVTVVVTNRERPSEAAAGAAEEEKAATAVADVAVEEQSEEGTAGGGPVEDQAEPGAAAAAPGVAAAAAGTDEAVRRAAQRGARGRAPRPRTPEERATQNAALAARYAELTATSDTYRKMMEVRARLPVWQHKAGLLQAIEENQVVIVSGATGSGKTTQTPQFVLEAAIAAGRGGECDVLCTQPRRISCMGVAARVADELCEPNGPGGLVGYSIRLESRAGPDTRLRFVTTGTLLRRLSVDPLLEGVSHVFVDEVHERDLLADFLLVVLKDLLQKRPDIKLILMSATVQSTLFSDYFGGCPVFTIPGRTFPVEIKFLDQITIGGKRTAASKKIARKPNANPMNQEEKRAQSQKGAVPTISPVARDPIDYDFVCSLVEHIISGQGRKHSTNTAAAAGAVLIFCPGFAEISQLLRDLGRRLGLGGGEGGRVRLFPLHGSMPSDQQRGIFGRMPDGIWKIVIATNIAETSITIDDVTHVIDTGRVKEMRYDPITRISALREVWVSKASAAQRAGRAGRVQAGHCWRLYPEDMFNQNMPEFTLPEMKRSPLEELILQVLLLELGAPGEFLARAPEPPPPAQVAAALQTLTEIGAVRYTNSNRGGGAAAAAEEPGPGGGGGGDWRGRGLALTPLGYHLAQLPVDARVGKLLLWGCIFQCLDPVLSIAAALCHKSPLVSPFNKQQEATAAREEYFSDLKSDHLAVVRAYEGWRKKKREGNKEVRSFCDKRFLSSKSLEMIHALRDQFIKHLKDANFIPQDSSSHDTHVGRPRPFISPLVPNSIKCVSSYAQDFDLVKAILTGALYPAVASLVRPGPGRGAHLLTRDGTQVHIHPASVNFPRMRSVGATGRAAWVLYHSKVQSSRVYLHDSTFISAFSLLLFGGDVTASQDKGTTGSRRNALLSVDEWVSFKMPKEAAVLCKVFRLEIDRLLLTKIEDPSANCWQRGNAITAVVRKLLESERG